MHMTMVRRAISILPNRRPAHPLELAPFLHTGRSRNRATGARQPRLAPEDNLMETAT